MSSATRVGPSTALHQIKVVTHIFPRLWWTDQLCKCRALAAHLAGSKWLWDANRGVWALSGCSLPWPLDGHTRRSHRVAWCGMVWDGVTGCMSCHVTSLGQRACREGLCSPCPTLCADRGEGDVRCFLVFDEGGKPLKTWDPNFLEPLHPRSSHATFLQDDTQTQCIDSR